MFLLLFLSTHCIIGNMKRQAKRTKKRILNIQVSQEQYDYALALSKRVEGCPRPEEGSIAHGFKWALCSYAKSEGLNISVS